MAAAPDLPTRAIAREQLPYWIGFNRVPGIGVVRLRQLIDVFGDVRIAWEAPTGQLTAAGIRGRALEALLRLRRTLDVERELQRTEAAGVEVVTIDEERYPARLREIYGAPPV